jgi:GAF domain-containing protein
VPPSANRQDPISRAFVVARQGTDGRPVIASDWWAALGQVLREEGLLDDLRELGVRVTPRGVVVRCGDVVLTVREHVPPVALADTDLDASADVRAACERALDAALRAVPAESGAVLLVERRYLRFVAARGPHAPTLIGVRLPSSSGVAGYVLQTQRSLAVGDAARHPRHDGSLDALTGYRTRQILAVPLDGGGLVHGVLELMNPPEGQRFGPEERRRVEEVARVLGSWLGREPRVF